MILRSKDADKLTGSYMKHGTLHLANERTFLAWVRTAIGIMAFGFLVERFGTRLLPQGSSSFRCNCAAWAGLGLVLLGVAVAILATYRFVRTERDIMLERLRPSPAMDVMVALVLAVVGLLVALYLVVLS